MAGNPLDDIREILKSTLDQLSGQNSTIIDLLRRQVEETRKTSAAKNPIKDKLGSGATDMEKFGRDWRQGIERLLGDRGIGGLVKKITTFGQQFDQLARNRGTNVPVPTGGNRTTIVPLGQAQQNYQDVSKQYRDARENLKKHQEDFNVFMKDLVKQQEEYWKNVKSGEVQMNTSKFTMFAHHGDQLTAMDFDPKNPSGDAMDYLHKNSESARLEAEMEGLADAVKSTREAYKKSLDAAGPFEKLMRLFNNNIGAGAIAGKMIGGPLGGIVGALAGSYTKEGQEITGNLFSNSWKAMRGKETDEGESTGKLWKAGKAGWNAYKAFDKSGKWGKSWAMDKALQVGTDMFNLGDAAGAATTSATSAAASDAVVMAEIVGGTGSVGATAAGAAGATGAAAGGAAATTAAGGGAALAGGATVAAATGPPGWVIGAIAIGLTLLAKGTIMAVGAFRKMNEEIVKTALTFANVNADMAMMAGQNEVRDTIRQMKSGQWRSGPSKFANNQEQEFQDRTRIYGDMWHNVKALASGSVTWIENRMLQFISTPLEIQGTALSGIWHFLKGDLGTWLKSQDKLEASELNGPYANMLMAMVDNPAGANFFMDRKAGFFPAHEKPAPKP